MWFRVDDTLAFHRKAMQAGNAAMGLWVRAGSWAGQQLTNGYVPDDVARTLGTRQEIKRLCDVGLWSRIEDGYVFHQWEERNPTRDEVEQRRKNGAERLRRWREKHPKPGDDGGDGDG
jgi:hypothetical protein